MFIGFYTCTKLDTFIKELNASCIECVEGVLVDSLIFETDTHIYFAYEHYLNCWCSNLRVYRYSHTYKNQINSEWEYWYKFFADYYEKEVLEV